MLARSSEYKDPALGQFSFGLFQTMSFSICPRECAAPMIRARNLSLFSLHERSYSSPLQIVFLPTSNIQPV